MNGLGQPLWTSPIVLIAFLAVAAWVALRGYRRLRRSAEAAQGRVFEGLKVHDGPGPGLVAVVFHTYHGFVAFVEVTEHRFWAPPEDAREALRRLHRSNLRWGMVAEGAILIPFVTSINYLIQRRPGRKQEAAARDMP